MRTGTSTAGRPSEPVARRTAIGSGRSPEEDLDETQEGWHTVRVITGKDKGKEGVIGRVYPDENKVIVNGVNTAAKHQKAAPARATRPGSSTRTCRSTLPT